jgi:hypothetical protein
MYIANRFHQRWPAGIRGGQKNRWPKTEPVKTETEPEKTETEKTDQHIG